MGATVIAAASSPDKRAAARRCGADLSIDYVREDLRARLKEITNGRGVDVVCDPVGGAYTEPAFRSTGWGGRYLVVGFATGEIPRIGLNLALLKGSSIVGVYWGGFRAREPDRSSEELKLLLRYAAEHRIEPLVTAHYSLAEGPRALADVYERRTAGKVLIEP